MVRNLRNPKVPPAKLTSKREIRVDGRRSIQAFGSGDRVAQRAPFYQNRTDATISVRLRDGKGEDARNGREIGGGEGRQARDIGRSYSPVQVDAESARSTRSTLGSDRRSAQTGFE